ncbi:MAG: hypothetical protein J6386_23265 [Candidatus Synoicihabitans palmerolidicus]|nr:hypothetical protein [Candidatus Synoicihabitans palmerolidicus]
MTARSRGRGRAVYAEGLTFAPESTRLLHRALFWAAGKESDWAIWQTSNVRTECAWFPRDRQLVVINNDGSLPQTTVTLGDGETAHEVTLEPHGIQVLTV